MFGFLSLAFLLVVATAALTSDSQGEGLGLTVIAGIVLTVGSLFTALVLGGLSWAMLGKAFVHPRWSVILVPGLVGTLASLVATFIGWPTSEVVGGFVAYRMVSHRLARRSSPDPRGSQHRSWRDIIAAILGILSLCLVMAWAAYLLYWGFVEDHSSGAHLSSSEEILVLTVVLVPSLAAAAGLVGVFELTKRAAILRWIGVVTVSVFVVSPGLLGGGYVPGAVLMLLSAILASDRRDTRMIGSDPRSENPHRRPA
jgi:hypothetical protein